MTASSKQIILEEAAEWLVRFQSETLSSKDLAVFEQWRDQSAEHTAAWARAESMMRGLGQVPPDLGGLTLRQINRRRRRQLLRAAGAVLVAGPAAWLMWNDVPWREWTADVRTAVGEQRRLTLDDGTVLVLNTDSAVDILYTLEQRLIWLQTGEILVTTGKDTANIHRPFIVRTASGTVRALGTRFMMRLQDGGTSVAVFESAVEIQPLASDAPPALLSAGRQAFFDQRTVQPDRAVDSSSPSWEQGMLTVRNWRLADLVHELNRYRRGLLRCDPEVADLRVSGAFPLSNVDTSLHLLEQSLPLKISRFTPYWTTLGPRR